MPVEITTTDALGQYLRGVMDRARHHAEGVQYACLAIAGGIAWRAESIEVMRRDGELKNVLWMTLNGQRYAFSYNHEEESIEVRLNNLHGPLHRSFTNDTSPAEITEFFKAL